MDEKITIDKEACILCRNCIEVCGSNTLEIRDNTLVQTMPELCSACAHCAAVCPTNAISANQNSVHFFELKEIDKSLSEIENLLVTKRSVRAFTQKNIEKTTLEKLIYFAEKSPSSSNARKREYTVITDKNRILELEKLVVEKYNFLLKILNPVLLSIIKLFSKKMFVNLQNTRTDILQMNKQFENKDYPIFRNATCIVLISAPKDIQSKDDCIIAQQYMMLYAHSLNIGSCVIGYAQYVHKIIEKMLNMPKNHTIYAVSTFGYPKYKMNKEIIYDKKTNITWL